ncbi:MAG: hypothetical protein MK165_20145 [Pirellulaceae bacterium]|nr:hypothetical protein [Pirellulaceae bacterium]
MNVAALIRHTTENGWDPIAATEDVRIGGFDVIAGKMGNPHCTPDSHVESDESR